MRGTNNGSSLRMTKMSVKLLILFHILFYFDFRESLPDIESLEIQFKHKIINQQNANINHLFCSMDRKKWAGLCRKMLSELNSDPEYKYKLYVNYRFFNDGLYNCEYKMIKFVTEPSVVTKFLLPCPSRPAIVNDYEENINDLWIYAYNKFSMLVFTCKSVSNDCTLLHSIGCHWLQVMEINPILLNSLPPRSITNKETIYLRLMESKTQSQNPNIQSCSLIFNENNVLIKTPKDLFIRLCTWIYGRESFRSYLRISSNSEDYDNKKPQSISGTATIQNFPSFSLRISTYPCSVHYVTDLKIKTTKYGISPGPDDRSVLLTKRIGTKDNIYFILMELIENFDFEYLNNDW